MGAFASKYQSEPGATVPIMRNHRDVKIHDQGDGTWSILLRDAPVRTGLTRDKAETLASKTPSELVKGTELAQQWFSRGAAAERIAGMPAEDVCDPIRSGKYALDLFDLYDRMWDIGQDQGDGTRLFRPRPGSREALKWLIEDLAGTPTDPEKTMPDNNSIRRAVHARIQQRGWAERINQVSFRLLRDPDVDKPGTASHNEAVTRHLGSGELAEQETAVTLPVDELHQVDVEPDEDGEAIVDVIADDVISEDGALRLCGIGWSSWSPLEFAAREATTSPGVYIARSGADIVYVGMAGERRGMGVRGRLQIYARGRGAVSGLGEAALDRALADPVWLGDRLARLQAEGPERAKQWAADAMRHADLHLCWTSAPDSETARAWETDVLQELEDVALWNRARPRKPTH